MSEEREDNKGGEESVFYRGELVGVREVRDLGGRENVDVHGEESHEGYCADGAREQLPQ